MNERSHHENQLEINKDDSTKCWKIIKEVIGNSAGLKDQSPSIKVNGSVIKDSVATRALYKCNIAIKTCLTSVAQW